MLLSASRRYVLASGLWVIEHLDQDVASKRTTSVLHETSLKRRLLQQMVPCQPDRRGRSGSDMNTTSDVKPAYAD